MTRLQFTARTSVLLWMLTCAGLAQVTTAAISGMVVDASSARIPGAKVTLRRISTDAERTLTTDGEGRYLAADLEPGTYEVQAEKANFETEVRRGIVLTVGRRAVVDFSLKVGQVREKVVVTGEAPLVDVGNSSIGHVVEHAEIDDLPLNGRNYTQLTLLAPGVVNVTTFAGSSFFGLTQRIAVAGARAASGGVYLLDGANVMSFFNDNAGNPGLGTALGVDAIEEFKVETNSFSPEYARSGAAVINAISRSGTNQAYGSIFEFVRNSAVDARNYFDGPAIPLFRRNQFGAVAGGPIVADKMFYFASYEGLREALGETEIGGTPDNAARQGNLPSGTVAVNPAIVPLLGLFPTANGPDLGGGVAEVRTTAGRNTNEDYVSARFDQHISAKDAFFARAIADVGSLDDPYPIAGSYLPFYQQAQGRDFYSTLQETHLISPTAVNAARIGFNRNNSAGNSTAQPAALNLIPGVSGRAPGAVTIGGVGYIGPNPIVPYYLILNEWSFADDITFVKGPHFLKVGFEWDRIQDPYRADLYSGGSMTFNTLADFLTGNPYTFVAPLPGELNTRRTWNQNVAGMYAADSWRVRKRLTLNLGARYEFITNPTESNGLFSALVNLSDATVTHEPHVFSGNPSLKNIAPRFGFAWSPARNGETSVRGGFGIFYQEYMPRDYAEYGFNPPQTVLGVGIYPGFPISTSVMFGLPPSISLVTGYEITKTPYVMEYNLNVQREILPNLMIELGGVFSQGRKLLGSYDYNQPLPNATLSDGTPIRTATATRPNPYFSTLAFTYPIDSSNYNSLVATLEKRFTNHTRIFAAYVWSHSLDTQSNEFNGDGWNDAGETTDINDLKMDYGNSTFDLRQSLTMNYVYDLPVKRTQPGIAAALLNGWQTSGIVSATTGLPFSVENGFDRANTMQTLSPPEGSERPDLKPGRSNNPVLGSPRQWFDPSAFALQPAGAFGNLGRDTVRGPGLANFDAGLLRTIRLRERLAGQFRFEVFNVFNRANFAVPAFPEREVFLDASGTINPQAGEITQTVDSSRQMQLAARLNF